MEFVDLVKSLSIGDVGFAGLLTLAIYLVLTGRLVPRTVLEDVRADRDARILAIQEDRDVWKEAFHISEAGRERQNGLLGESLELGRTSVRILQSLPRVPEIEEKS